MAHFSRMPLAVRQVRSMVIDPEAPVSLEHACGAESVELPAVSAEEQTPPLEGLNSSLLELPIEMAQYTRSSTARSSGY